MLLETRHVKAALAAMNVKTDRRAARGIDQLLPLGRYRRVYAKSANARVALARKLAWSSTACGSMAPPSAGPTTELQSHKKESFEHGQTIGLRHRGPVAGTVKLVKPQWQR